MQFYFSNLDELLKFAEVSLNKEVSKALKELGRLQIDPWKGVAYSRAAHNIENLNQPINSLSNLKDIEGVGNDIAKEIQEYIETGKINKLEILKEEEEKGKGKFNLKDAVKISEEFFSLAKSLGLKYTITGSIRRKLPKVKDIDAIVLLEEIEDWKYLVEEMADEILREGKEEIDFIFNGIGINLRAIREDEWGSGVLFFTGPRSHEIFLKQLAKKKGYLLNRHGLFRLSDNKHIAYKTEEEIYNALGLYYIKPEER